VYLPKRRGWRFSSAPETAADGVPRRLSLPTLRLGNTGWQHQYYRRCIRLETALLTVSATALSAVRKLCGRVRDAKRKLY